MKNFAASIHPLRKAATIGVSAAALLMVATSAHATSLVLNGSFSTNSGSVSGVGCKVSTAGCVADWTSAGYSFLYTSAADAQNPGVSGVEMWGPSSGKGGSVNGFGASPDGGAFLALDGDYQTGSVQQTITGITAGDTYAVSFYWAAAQQEGFDGATIQAMNVCLGTAGESYKNTSNQPLSGADNAPSNINCSGSGASTTLYDLSNHAFSGWESETVYLTATSSSDDVLSFLAYGNVQQPPFALLDGVSMNQVTPEPSTLPLLLTGLMGGLGVLRSKKLLKSR
jgi:hypothetical protein